MKSSEVRRKYLDFFQKRGHIKIPSFSLIPKDDPTTLFTSAGMQPMIKYLLGESHPQGKRLVDSQKCFRSQDILEVGDSHHTTFFEMLGNWSFGDYFKAEQLEWIFEFLTTDLGLDPNRLYVSAFVGDPKNNLPKDSETVQVWKKLFSQKGIDAKEIELGTPQQASDKGMNGGRIFYYTTANNWWSRTGEPETMPEGEPGGPDSEMFYLLPEVPHNQKYGKNCHPNCGCGRFLEIGNSVFMQYQKTSTGFRQLPQKNVDFGGGLERLTAAVSSEPDIFRSDLFLKLISMIERVSSKKYFDNKPFFRVIADHLKAATFLIKDGVTPSNKLQGYILRRLLRRVAIKLYLLTGKISPADVVAISDMVIDTYSEIYFNRDGDYRLIAEVIRDELGKFSQTLQSGLKEVDKIVQVNGKLAFNLYQSFGFPFEILEELFKEKGQDISRKKFDSEFRKHQELSRYYPKKSS